MTCIVGHIQGNSVWIGGDTLASAPPTGLTLRESKVFQNGPFIFGFAHSYRLGQLLRLLKPPKHPPAMSDEEYIIGPLIDAIRQLYCDRGAMSSDDPEGGPALVLAYKAKLYGIYPNFQVIQPAAPYICIGTGGETANGAMYVLCQNQDNSNYSPFNRVELALKAAAEHCVTVRAPFTFLKQEGS